MEFSEHQKLVIFLIKLLNELRTDVRSVQGRSPDMKKIYGKVLVTCKSTYKSTYNLLINTVKYVSLQRSSKSPPWHI